MTLLIKTHTYDELQRYALEWAQGTFKHLFLIGYAGSSKTYTVTEAVKDVPRTEHVKGHITPKRLFQLMQQWENQGIKLVILDDIQGMTHNDEIAGLLKQALENGQVTWGTTQAVDQEKIEVSMRFCIITNYFGDRKGNEHLAAIKDRCMVIQHEPSAMTTLNYALSEHLIDDELAGGISFIGWPRSGVLSLRELGKLQTIKSIGSDWQEIYKEYTRNH